VFCMSSPHERSTNDGFALLLHRIRTNETVLLNGHVTRFVLHIGFVFKHNCVSPAFLRFSTFSQIRSDNAPTRLPNARTPWKRIAVNAPALVNIRPPFSKAMRDYRWRSRNPIPKGASIADMGILKGKANIGDQINKKIIAPLANANKLADMPDFNDATKLGSGKEMIDRLTNLIAIFENKALDFSKNRADGDDILGDAYEYLMRHFATESGKSQSPFYTPPK
jgi:hypothetical protein